MTQEEVDEASAALTKTPVTEKAVADLLYKLPDSEAGANAMPDGYQPVCVLYDESITDVDDLGARYGKFVHVSCDEGEYDE